MVFRGLGGGEMRSECLVGTGILWGAENVLKLDRGDGCTTL